MRNFIQKICFLLLITCAWGCGKQNTSNAKFVGTWTTKGAASSENTDTVIFYSNGKLSVRYDQLLTSYTVVSSDSIQINASVPMSIHGSYYFFISNTELYMSAFEDDVFGGGFVSDTLIKN